MDCVHVNPINTCIILEFQVLTLENDDIFAYLPKHLKIHVTFHCLSFHYMSLDVINYLSNYNFIISIGLNNV